jgi:protein ImuA
LSTLNQTQQHLPAGVWRASDEAAFKEAAFTHSTFKTQHHVLDSWLPGAGWPLGSLTEILIDGAGCGELSLVAPALAHLPKQRPIVLLKPPSIPNALAWQQWGVDSRALWWLSPEKCRDAWWCAQTILRSRAFAALLAWIDPLDENVLRHLHGCAQDSRMLIFLFRPASVGKVFSPAPLRLKVRPGPVGAVQVQLLKTKGRKPADELTIDVAHHAITDHLKVMHVGRPTTLAAA